MMRRLSAFGTGACCALFLTAAAGFTASAAVVRKAAALPPIRHVFVITLENKNYSDTFGPNSQAPYLAKTLRAQGALLTRYYGTGHDSLDNYIAMMGARRPHLRPQKTAIPMRTSPRPAWLPMGRRWGMDACIRLP